MRQRSSLRATLALAAAMSLLGVIVPAAVPAPAAATTTPAASAASAVTEVSGQTDGVVVVTFESVGGTPVDPQHVQAGNRIEMPERPTRDGWVFVGWYTDRAATVHMWDFLNGTAQDSMTLYAKWVQVDETHRLLNAYASPEELQSPYVAATLQTLGTLSEDERALTLPAGTTVYVAPGVYWTDQTYREGGVIEGPNIGLSILGEDVSFLGLTGDATDTIVAGNRGEGGETGLGANGSWYSLGISTGFRGENITFANYAQEDLVYPRDPSQNIEKRLDSKNHAEVLTRAHGTEAPDRLYFENMRFIGYLNMMIGLAPVRAYFLDSFFQLTDDAIFSGDTVVYENSTFHLFGNHPSFSGAGNGGIAVLLGSKVVGMPQMTSTDLYLAKQSTAIGPEANALFAILDTQFTGRIQSVEWENVVREDARHFVSNNTIGDDGEPLVISPSEPQTSVPLSGAALNAFKVGDEYNVYNLLKGDDGWDPKGQNDAEWEPYANLPYRFVVGATGKTMYSGETGSTNTAVLTPAPAPVGSVDLRDVVWDYDANLLDGAVDPTTGGLTLTAKPNHTGAIIETIATATLPSGISAGATLRIRPVPVDAPVVSAPSIALSENLASLDYTLDQPGYKDASVIDWYRESGPETTDGVHIGTMRNDAAGFFVDDPFTEYPLSRYDVGHYLRAVITPKYEFSDAGSPVTVHTTRAVTAADVTTTSLSTDFKNVYITDEDHATTVGRWFFDRVSGTAVPWGWGIGTNGTDRIWGLQNNSRTSGTRLVFGQDGDHHDMSLDLSYSTSKVEGQGFGGNGQFMDIYVKYDPATRTGYGLRVERTAAGGSNATTWTLHKYDGDTLTPLTEPVRTAAFMPKSTITVSVTGATLRVRASTESQRTPLQTAQGLTNEVDISWTDDTGALRENAAGGFGFRIENTGNSSYDYAGSGTTTNNTVMLHEVRVETAEATEPEPTGSDRLEAGAVLTAGQGLLASGGAYRLVVQTDGNVVVYDAAGAPLWSTQTAGNPGAWMAQQTDGNLVVYSAAGRPLWSTGQVGAGTTTLVMQGDGNLVQYRAGQAVWAAGPDPALAPPPPPGTLTPGRALAPGQGLVSTNGDHRLVMQGDGNLVLYTGSSPRWSSGTPGQPGARFAFQGDGNAVVYSAAGQPLWHSATVGVGASSMVLQDDGNLVIYSASRGPVWNTGPYVAPPPPPTPATGDRVAAGQVLRSGASVASPGGGHRLVMQTDGNLVLYTAAGTARWATGTNGNAGARLVFQHDGNAVVYSTSGRPVWSTGTSGSGGDRIVVQDDGNLVVYARDRAVWSIGPDVPPGRPATPPPPPGRTAPAHPGDAVDCSDFGSWDQAQAWFLTYYPYYGDVARLDANDDGIACNALRG